MSGVTMNIEAIAKAIETDAGFELPELREILAEMGAINQTTQMSHKIFGLLTARKGRKI